MNIAIINFDISPAGVNEMLYATLPELMKNHTVTGIEIDHHSGEAVYKPFSEENVTESRNQYKKLLKSSTLKNPNIYQAFLPFDAIVVIGTDQSLKGMEKVTELVEGTKFLFVPVSIHNDIEGSDLSLGYDSAINSIVGSILKIRDTIDSLKYDKPRLFGIEIPGEAPKEMLQELALAVGGFYFSEDFIEKDEQLLVENLKTCFEDGQTYSFLIFTEKLDEGSIHDKVLSCIEVDWKVNQIDEALCIGPSPTAADRILAMKLAQQMLSWVRSCEGSGKLLIRSREARFFERHVTR